MHELDDLIRGTMGAILWFFTFTVCLVLIAVLWYGGTWVDTKIRWELFYKDKVELLLSEHVPSQPEPEPKKEAEHD